VPNRKLADSAGPVYTEFYSAISFGFHGRTPI
jgi:hypothetical protein